ncbi:MAG: VRR-NUC domain-containing protein [Deltaproteobacteria bacterium]|nr:MAG: VRR-NUC domain-containing protein [Deltaproteobacteria bacterium]
MTKQPTHKQLVKAIKKLIIEHGGYCFKHYSGGPVGLNGVADLIGVFRFRGKGIAIEVKTGRDRLSSAQAKFLENWRQAGGTALEARDVKTVADALDIPMLI